MASVEYPPLGKTYVISYSNGDKDFPILAIKKDPRVDNYKRPDDLSPHPDSTRYPNHVFTGTQPTNTDERVIWVYEILPSPWIPFTRYDDDLGPIQGRRRSVINSGQEATLSRDKRVTYEAREGSAIVSTEIEESWNAGSTDPDAESPFPIKDRDFYDPSRGAVQERRQLRPTTGDEVATLENNNGVITQTSYEAYNEYLSFKIVQTYSVDGPQLIGNATNNEGQLVTVTTQRKAALNYVPPSPTATRIVEASREDAESIVERISETDGIFGAGSTTVERLDPLPSKFRVKLNTKTSQRNEIMVGQQFEPTLNLGRQEISKTEQQLTKFVKRISTVSRDYAESASITGGKIYTSELGGGIAEVTETFTGDLNPLSSFPQTDINPQFGTISAERENLGNDEFIIKEVKLPTPLPILKGQNYDETLDVSIPYTRQFVEAGTEEPTEPSSIDPRDSLHSLVTKFDYEEARTRLLDVSYVTASIESVSLPDKLVSAQLVVNYDSAGENSLGSGRSGSVGVSVSSDADAALVYQIEDGYKGVVDAESHVFFLPKDQANMSDILAKIGGVQNWPKVRPESYRLYASIVSERQSKSISASLPNNVNTTSFGSKNLSTENFYIPPTIHGQISLSSESGASPTKEATATLNAAGTKIIAKVIATASVNPLSSLTIGATNYTTFPTGRFLYRLETSPFRFGLVRVSAVVVNIEQSMV